jgi:1,4-dihydroxy-2-naphthoyl-CoA synthase
VIFTGAGDKAFCAGGDVKERAETGSYGETESGMFEIQYLHEVMRSMSKPVIAAVNGVAIGGGHVLHVLADLSTASSTARFGQAGPRVRGISGCVVEGDAAASRRTWDEP